MGEQIVFQLKILWIFASHFVIKKCWFYKMQFGGVEGSHWEAATELLLFLFIGGMFELDHRNVLDYKQGE